MALKYFQMSTIQWNLIGIKKLSQFFSQCCFCHLLRKRNIIYLSLDFFKKIWKSRMKVIIYHIFKMFSWKFWKLSFYILFFHSDNVCFKLSLRTSQVISKISFSPFCKIYRLERLQKMEKFFSAFEFKRFSGHCQRIKKNVSKSSLSTDFPLGYVFWCLFSYHTS